MLYAQQQPFTTDKIVLPATDVRRAASTDALTTSRYALSSAAAAAATDAVVAMTPAVSYQRRFVVNRSCLSHDTKAATRLTNGCRLRNLMCRRRAVSTSRSKRIDSITP